MSTDLGYVELIGADAVGQPGQRRFRLFVRTPRGSAVLWMEKEQLNSLSLAIDRFLAQLTQGQILRTEAQSGGQPMPEGMPADFPRKPSHDVQVVQMRLTYEERSGMLLLSAVPGEIIQGIGEQAQLVVHEEETISFLFTQQQAQRLASDITVLVAAGRPVCPFCHTPLDGSPHACIKQNGHREIIQDEEEEEE